MGNSGGSAAVSVVNLFCGAGGTAYEFAKAGLSIADGIGAGEPWRHVFAANTGARFTCKPVEDIAPNDLSGPCRGRGGSALIGRAPCRGPSRSHSQRSRGGRSALIGRAPCQPFSSCSMNRSPNFRRFILNAFARLVRAISRDLTSMKSVPRLRPHVAESVDPGDNDAGHRGRERRFDRPGQDGRCPSGRRRRSRRSHITTDSRQGGPALGLMRQQSMWETPCQSPSRRRLRWG